LSHPVTRSKRKLKKKRHKAKMRKLAKKREKRLVASAQREPLGSQIMQDEQNAAVPEQAAGEQPEVVTEPIDGEIVEAEEGTEETHVEAESTTETTTEVQAEPGTSVIPASASAEEDDSL